MELTKVSAENISELYTSNNKALTIFSPDFIEQYKQACVKECLKYVGQSKDMVINSLMKFSRVEHNAILLSLITL